jgi:hypothetical protein
LRLKLQVVVFVADVVGAAADAAAAGVVSGCLDGGAVPVSISAATGAGAIADFGVAEDVAVVVDVVVLAAPALAAVVVVVVAAVAAVAASASVVVVYMTA